MTTKHTEKIVGLYANDTGYEIEEFEGKYGTGEETVVTSESKYNIPVYYYEANDVSLNRVIILVHWHESNHKEMYPLAKEFLQLGYRISSFFYRGVQVNSEGT